MTRSALSQRCVQFVVLALVAGFLCLADPTPAGAAAAPTTPLSESAALAAAATSGQPVEVTGLTTETEQTFANPAGSLTLTQSVVPVRVRRNHAWVPVDTTLIRRADGTIGPAAAAVSLTFSGGGPTTPLAHVLRSGTSVSWSWPAALPTPTLAGDTATYAEVLPGVDLLVRAQADGFSELLVVKTAAAAGQAALRQIRFGSKVGGGSLRAQSAGGFSIVDGLGVPVFASPQPLMWDSSPPTGAAALTAPGGDSGRDPTRAPGDASRVASMPEQSDSKAVSVTPDQALLGGRSTVFPVYIDPAISVSAPRLGWTMVDARYPTTSYYKQTDPSIWGVGYNDTTGAVHTKRLFWNFDTDKTRGKHIISSTFSVKEVFAYSCTPTAVYLWQTGAVSATTTWNTQPSAFKQLDSKTVAYGRDGCFPAGQTVEFNPLVAIADSAAKGYTVTAMGLRALETSNAYWKRFQYDAVLSITYNTPPATPTSLRRGTTPCYSALDSGVPVVPDDQPLLTANFSDPDGGNVAGLFELFVAPAGSLYKSWTNIPAASGLDQSVRAPSLAPGTYFWRTRGYDGVDTTAFSYSPYSVRCYFKVDPSLRPPPTVTAPAGQTYAVGVPATFTLGTGGASGIVSYRWALNNTVPTSTSVAVSSPTITVTPQHFGDNLLSVWSYDAGGVQSATSTGVTMAVAGSNEAGQWQLDAASGLTEPDSSAGAHPMTLTPGATSGVPGRWNGTDPTDKAVTFNGATGSAATSATDVVDSSQNFSASAWVRLADTSVRRAAVSKDGSAGSAFSLGFVPGGSDAAGNPITGSFAFTMADPSGGSDVVAAQQLQALTGEWVHLVGVYNAGTRQLTLYVSGQYANAVTLNAVETVAGGAVAIGRGRAGSAAANFWSGDVDDVHVFAGAIDPGTVTLLATATRP